MPKHRDARFQVRMEQEMLDNAQEVAQQRGWSLGAVIRAFFRDFTEHTDEAVERLDVEDEHTKAEYDHQHARSKHK